MCHRVTYILMPLQCVFYEYRCSIDCLVQMYCFRGSITLLFILLLINTYIILCVRSIINIHLLTIFFSAITGYAVQNLIYFILTYFLLGFKIYLNSSNEHYIFYYNDIYHYYFTFNNY